MVYMTVRAEKKVQKIAHFLLHLCAIILGIVGLHAAFKYHDRSGLRNLYSFHSWIGIGTFSLYILQVLTPSIIYRISLLNFLLKNK